MLNKKEKESLEYVQDRIDFVIENLNAENIGSITLYLKTAIKDRIQVIIDRSVK